MRAPKNYISKDAAVANLKRFFSASPNADQLALSELFTAVGRAQKSEQTNRNWLANKMTQFRYYGLVQPLYSYGQRKELAGLRLTMNGKKALGRVTDNLPAQTSNKVAGLDTVDLANAIRAFKRNYPEFDVIFELKLRKSL